MTFLDNRAAIKTLDQAHRSVSSRPAANPAKSSVPRIIALGGDHTTTLSALRGTHANWGPVSVIHFDSHIGTQTAPPPFPQAMLEVTMRALTLCAKKTLGTLKS